MKHAKRSLPAMACALLFSGIALAGHDGAKTMDTDGDGKLSASEHETGARMMFEAMDKDKDGKVTAAEMDAAHAAMGKKPMAGEMSSAGKIKVVDTDGDGALSSSEHAAGSKGMFSKMDADQDGFVSKEESEAAHKAMMTK